MGELIPIIKGNFDGPAERYRFAGAPGEIGFISPLSHLFCHACNRMRLTADGRLRACLLCNDETDLKGPMRGHASDAKLQELFLKTDYNKRPCHGLDAHKRHFFFGQMSSIGG